MLKPGMVLTATDIFFFFLIDPVSNRDGDNILLNYSHFSANIISIYLHFMPYLLPPYNYHANDVLTVTSFSL